MVGSSATDIVGGTEEDPPTVVVPMAQLVADREAFAPSAAARVDGDHGTVARADDPRFAPVKRPVANPRAHAPGYGL
jgi:hypothetical protein